MIRNMCGVVALMLPAALLSAPAACAELSELQLRGRALFNQSCRVCHTPPALNAPLYGPALAQDTQRGKDDVLTEIIRDGSPRMPGFKYQFGTDQIGAIVAYLRTIPAEPGPPPRADRRGRSRCNHRI